MRLGWYANRLRLMSVAEVTARVQVAARQRYWRRPGRRPGGLRTAVPGRRAVAAGLHRADAPAGAAASDVVAAADRLLAGTWPVFHLADAALADPPDWFRDPLTGTEAPRAGYAFAVPYRDERKVGNIKFVWELSRHQAATMLAAAWWITGNDAYAERAAAHLCSWWRENPFLTGVHWTSGIEAGLRLLSWTWIRLLLADWPWVGALFERNEAFVGQLYHHQLYVRAFHSRGSSANNHLIAELAGLSAAAAAFPWFAESPRWAAWARTGLVRQAGVQTHPDGCNREQASEYHQFVLDMLMAAVLAAHLSGQPFPPAMDRAVVRMADALAAGLDATGRPPRFGDGDEGRGVLLDAPGSDGVTALLDAAGALGGPAPWWPARGDSVLGHVAVLATRRRPTMRDVARPGHFPGAGMTILRSRSGPSEVWVRCDAGPHGYLSIAAHGHADALSVELRVGGVELFADPGTYCYHGETEWRGYFRGSASHNTLMLDGMDQAVPGGPSLWLTQPRTVLAETGPQRWQASHDGYRRLPDPVTHHRRVELDGGRAVLLDWIDAAQAHAASLSFHLGPAIAATLDGTAARLAWDDGAATLALPSALAWTLHRGESDPPLGWYSRGFGHKEPSYTLVGRGRLAAGTVLCTVLDV